MLKLAIAAALVGTLGSVAHAGAVTTWSHTNFAAIPGRFTVTFDLVPTSVGRSETFVGLSHNATKVLTGLATSVRLNSSGRFDVLDKNVYRSAVAVAATAGASYHFREVVDLSNHNYSVYVTYRGHQEGTLARDFSFRGNLESISNINFSNEADNGNAMAVRNLTVQDGGINAPMPTRCRYLAADDGCWGADAYASNDFALLEGYPHKPDWNVAGVTYHVGVPPIALRDPTAQPLPNGCSFASNRVTCIGSNVTVSGYDFAKNGTELYLPSSVTNANITGNKFALTSACVDPLIDFRGRGILYVAHNSLDGAGPTCQTLNFGTLISVDLQSGSTVHVEYNAFTNIPTDVIDFGGPTLGSADIVVRYNFFHDQGYQIGGHPDGTQFYGGNIGSAVIAFNTYYTSGNPIGDQPFHVEAQGGSATAPIRINSTTVSYNTVMTPGTCNSGANFPVGCIANFDIACKADDSNSSNVAFSAYGNYVDWSGAIAALDDPISSNGTACAGSTWGRPAANIDMKTGLSLPLAH